ncbi:MAG: hypothetical protein IJ751_04640 [Oscillospiraceae bacterium]|nr:hypothetical protein [Oscillospiraceae bacterium]
MAETIRLKSRAVEVYDFRRVDISRFITGFAVDEAQLKKDLERVLRRYGRQEDAAQVCEGDTVTLNCRSDVGRYNKTGVPVPVGKGLFSPALEEQMVGMARGEERTLTVDGTAVTVEIVRIRRAVLPELTDENVASFGMEGVTTADDLRRHCIARQVEGFLLEDENPDMAAAFVWQELAKNSQVERDPGECARVEVRADAKLREMTAGNSAAAGLDLETMRRIFVTELDLAAVGAELMERDGATLTTDDYAAYLDKLTEAYPGRTRAELMEEHSVEAFVIERCAEYTAQAIDGYVAETFRRALVK